MARKKTIDTEEKAAQARRIAVGATVAGMLLVLFLIIVLIVQFVKIGVRNAEKKRLEAQINYYSQLIENGEKDLEFYLSEQGLRMLAVQHGYISK